MKPQRKPVFLPEEALRRHFWQMAADYKLTDYATPFERIRSKLDMTQAEVAALMSMKQEDYSAMERGLVRVDAPGLLGFCDVMECHPLDLYSEPWGGVYLPREVLEALLMVAADGRYPQPYMARTHERLANEYRQARAMLAGNGDALVPLMAALGYAPDMSRYGAVFYRVANKAGQGVYGVRKYRDQRFDLERQKETPRGYLVNCLNGYGLVLERHAAVHKEVLEQFSTRITRNKQVMENLAAHIYGHNDVVEALDRLLAALPLDQRLRKEFALHFIENPGILFNMTPENRRILEYGGGEAEALRRKAHLLLIAGGIYLENEGIAARGEMERLKRVSEQKHLEFQEWRRSKRTQYLLGWAENWVALLRAKEDGYILQSERTPPADSSGLLPSTPR